MIHFDQNRRWTIFILLTNTLTLRYLGLNRRSLS